MKVKSYYECSACGYRNPKWLGKCPECGSWNTLEEITPPPSLAPAAASKHAAAHTSVLHTGGYAGEAAQEEQLLDDVSLSDYMRFTTEISELDRVLGGGLVTGSVILLSGEPGIGKSTLLLQLSAHLGKDRKVLYLSGEESVGQLKMRAKRLGLQGGSTYLLTETNIERILSRASALRPEIIIVDSVQTVWTEASSSAPGSVTQVRESTLQLLALAKTYQISVLLVGHVNKEGGIAGPKVLEHMVDAVLYFEGEREHSYRMIRAVKNRFGSTNEIGMFEMTGEGLVEVPNPSEALLAGRPLNVSGSCAVCIMEGSRPILAEIQALVCPTVLQTPRRTANGLDYNRLYLILAVLEKRLGLRFSACDAYMNVVGGLRLEEPAADLPAALALISGIKDIPIPSDLIAAGEIGLAGECRAITNLEQRIREAERLGFRRILVPARNAELSRIGSHSIEICPVKSIYEAMAIALRKET